MFRRQRESRSASHTFLTHDIHIVATASQRRIPTVYSGRI